MYFICLLVLTIVQILNADECDSSRPTVSYCDLNVTLRAILVEKFVFTSFHDYLPHLVRLIFHDCMGPDIDNPTDNKGKCDGCIDLTNGAHAGLPELALGFLDRAYERDDDNNWIARMSRADFWAASATIALQYANEIAMKGVLHRDTPAPTNDTLPFIPFYRGRVDCSDDGDAGTVSRTFPSATAGYSTNYAFFFDTFGFSEKEYVAALGAHTLGRVHVEHSGFGTAPWVQRWDTLDNEFYENLLNDNPTNIAGSFGWTSIPNPNNTDVYEWKNINENAQGGSERFSMLNADMALVLDIDNNIEDVDSGELSASCTYDSCGTNTLPKGYVQEYADDNQLWLTDFADVFTKMIQNGYDTDDLEILATDEYYNESGITPPTHAPTVSPTGAPSTAPTTPYSCTSEVSNIPPYTFKNQPGDWNGGTFTWDDSTGTVFDEDTDGKQYRDYYMTNTFLTEFECDGTTDANTIEYLYKYTTSTQNNNGLTRVKVHVIACCPGGETFGSEYNKPNQFEGNELYNGQPNVISDFTDTDDNGKWQLTTNKIITFIIIAVLLLIGAVAAFIYYKKRKKSKQEQDDMSDANKAHIENNQNNDDGINLTTNDRVNSESAV